MTLHFFKNTKPDKRMIEYDQAIVRLGLEKAELEREVEKKRNELNQISKENALKMKVFLEDRKRISDKKMEEIKESTVTLLDIKKKTADEKDKLESLQSAQKQVSDDITKCENDLKEVLGSINVHAHENSKLERSIEILADEIKQKETEKEFISSELRDILKEKNRIVNELQDLNGKKRESEQALEKANKDLHELKEIISVLQATNKEGLDLVSSFEGERKRLREKEEFLLRKEQDLTVYEKRVEKRAKDAGIDLKMTFK